MHVTDYQKEALMTEAPVDSIIGERFKKSDHIREVFSIFEHAIKNGEHLDRLKKALFYGKFDKTVSSVVEPLPPQLIQRLTKKNLRILHAAMGLITESAEIANALVDHLASGKDLDEVNLIEEAGDQMWYLALFLNALGSDFETAMTRNNTKLRKYRYASGAFSEEEANNRNLQEERKALSE